MLMRDVLAPRENSRLPIGRVVAGIATLSLIGACTSADTLDSEMSRPTAVSLVVPEAPVIAPVFNEFYPDFTKNQEAKHDIASFMHGVSTYM